MHFTKLKHIHTVNPLQTFRVWVCFLTVDIFCVYAAICHPGSRGECFSVFLCVFPFLPNCIGKTIQEFSYSNLCTKCTTVSRFMLFFSHTPNFWGTWKASSRLLNDFSKRGWLLGLVVWSFPFLFSLSPFCHSIHSHESLSIIKS